MRLYKSIGVTFERPLKGDGLTLLAGQWKPGLDVRIVNTARVVNRSVRTVPVESKHIDPTTYSDDNRLMAIPAQRKLIAYRFPQSCPKGRKSIPRVRTGRLDSFLQNVI